MDLQRLVQQYIDGWNRCDAGALLELFHKDVSFYDAFWMETCSGPDLPRYINDCFDEETHWYEQDGPLIELENGVILRYFASEWTKDGPGDRLFNGAEVILIKEDKIVDIADYYCNPDEEALREVARQTVRRHGRTMRIRHGMGSAVVARYRDRIVALMEQDKMFLDPNLTLSEIAETLGCSTDQLSHIVATEFGASFYSFLDRYRARYARELLQTLSDDPDYVYNIASLAGFRSVERFNRSFERFYRQSPTAYYEEHAD